jgi:hypothetical protein
MFEFMKYETYQHTFNDFMSGFTGDIAMIFSKISFYFRKLSWKFILK